jgi:radical SAM protein with 4Fe4S-binding SPASM domain
MESMTRDTIGGSDIAALFNLEFGCRRRLFYTVSQKPADYPFLGNPHTQRGQDLEPMIANKFQEKTGGNVKVVTEQLVHKKYPFMTGHIDRLITFEKDNGILEIKAPESARYIQQNGLSDGYSLQMQHYLNLSGLNWGYFAIFPLEDWSLYDFKVERDEKIIQAIEKEAVSFWNNCVEKKQAPDKLEDFNDKRCKDCAFRRSCRGEEYEYLREAERVEITGEEFADLEKAYTEIIAVKKEVEEQEEEIRKRISEKLKSKNISYGETENFIYDLRPSSRQSVNSKKLQFQYPDIYKELAEISYSQNLTIRSKKKTVKKEKIKEAA